MSEHEKRTEEISAWIDGELTQAAAEKLEREMDQDGGLKRLADELIAVKNAAQTAIPPVSPDLYARLKNRVDQRYRRSARGIFRFPQLGYALGVLAGAVLILFWVLKPSTHDPSLAEAEHQLAQAQQHYRLAIENLEQISLERLQSYPPQIASVYRQNLDIIDDAIAECEAWAQAHPQYASAYRDLTRMYEAKVELLRQILQG